MSLSKEFPEDLDFSPSRKLLKLCKSDGVLGFHCHFQVIFKRIMRWNTIVFVGKIFSILFLLITFLDSHL